MSCCFLQDPVFIEFSEMLFALFCGCVWRKTAFNGCLGRFETGVRLHGNDYIYMTSELGASGGVGGTMGVRKTYISPERVIKCIQLLSL